MDGRDAIARPRLSSQGARPWSFHVDREHAADHQLLPQHRWMWRTDLNWSVVNPSTMFSVFSKDPSWSPSVPILLLAPGHMQILTPAGTLWSCPQRQLREASDYTSLPQAQWQRDAEVFDTWNDSHCSEPMYKEVTRFYSAFQSSQKKKFNCHRFGSKITSKQTWSMAYCVSNLRKGGTLGTDLVGPLSYS